MQTMIYRFEDLRPLLDVTAEAQRAGIALMNREGATARDKQIARQMMRDAAEQAHDLRQLIADREQRGPR